MRTIVAGRLVEISGAVVRAETSIAVALGDVARVGEEGLLGEVIALSVHTLTAPAEAILTGLQLQIAHGQDNREPGAFTER